MSEQEREHSGQINMDGRVPYDWKSKYPAEARRKMLWEGIFVFLLFLFAVIMIYCTWMNYVCWLLDVPSGNTAVFNKYVYYSISGLLGGVVFGMKFMYRAVARGFWHEDRLAWRLLSPFIALVVSFVIGALIESNLIKSQLKLMTSTVVSIGFLSGYFADEAVGKMYEIASILFGKIKD